MSDYETPEGLGYEDVEGLDEESGYEAETGLEYEPEEESDSAEEGGTETETPEEGTNMTDQNPTPDQTPEEKTEEQVRDEKLQEMDKLVSRNLAIDGEKEAKRSEMVESTDPDAIMKIVGEINALDKERKSNAKKVEELNRELNAPAIEAARQELENVIAAALMGSNYGQVSGEVVTLVHFRADTDDDGNVVLGENGQPVSFTLTVNPKVTTKARKPGAPRAAPTRSGRPGGRHMLTVEGHGTISGIEYVETFATEEQKKGWHWGEHSTKTDKVEPYGVRNWTAWIEAVNKAEGPDFTVVE